MSELTVGTLSGLAANSYVIDVASGSTLDLSAGAVFPAGSVLRVEMAQMSGTQTFSTGSGTLVDLTGLSITMTPASTTSKFICQSVVYMSTSAQASYYSYNRATIIRDSTNLVNTRLAQTASDRTNGLWEYSIAALDEPATTSPVTYKVAATQDVTGGSEPLFINRRIDITELRAQSFLIVTEIAG